MNFKIFNKNGMSVLGLIVIIAILLVIMVVLLSLYNFNYNLFLKGFFKHDIQSNLNNASKIIVKELKNAKELEITDKNRSMNFRNLNEGSIYLDKSIIKMKKGWKEENLTDIKTVMVKELRFEAEDDVIIFKIRGNTPRTDKEKKNGYLEEYSVELRFKVFN